MRVAVLAAYIGVIAFFYFAYATNFRGWVYRK